MLLSAGVQAATITVTNNGDNGAGSLRNAIATAAAGDTIDFAASLAGQTIAFGSQITIGKALTIDGSAAPGIKLDGQRRTRILVVNAAVTLKHLTLQNGWTPKQYWGSYVETVGGGAIRMAALNTQLTIEDCAFLNNSATMGGAIQNDGNIVIRRSIFRDNEAYNGGALAGCFSSWCGQYDVSDSAFFNNRAYIESVNQNGDANAGAMGGVLVHTNQPLGGDVIISFRNSTFIGNKAVYKSGGATTFSGGVFLIGATVTLNLENCTFINNHSDGYGGVITVSGSDYGKPNAGVRAKGLTMINNTAPHGAAIFNIYSTARIDNSLIIGSGTGKHCYRYYGTEPLSGTNNLEWNGGDTNTCNTTSPVLSGAANITDIVHTTAGAHGGPAAGPFGAQEPMLTLPLVPGSAAIGRGAPGLLTHDQRGAPRSATAPNVGAFEGVVPTLYKTITVKKSVPTSAGYTAGGKFDIILTCGSGTRTLQLAGGGTDSMTVPVGDACTVTETVPAGVIASGYTNTAIIAPSQFTADQDQTVEIINRIVPGTSLPTGRLEIKKTVIDTLSGHDPAAEFSIVVNCPTTWTSATTVKLRDGQTSSAQALANDTCGISENPPAAKPTFEYLPAVAPSSTTIQAGVTTAVAVTNTVVTSGTPTYTVDLQNRLGTNPTGSGYTAGSGTFTMPLACGAYTWTSVLRDGDSARYTVPASAASCTLSTTTSPVLNTNFIWDHTYNPASPFTLTSNTTVTATHNARPGTQVIVTKRVTGSTYGYAGGKVDVTVTCPSGTHTFQLGKDESSSAIALTMGETCTVSESVPATGFFYIGYANLASITPSRFTVTGQHAVEIVNRIESLPLDKGMLTVTKTVTGNLAMHDPNSVFTIGLGCLAAQLPVATLNLRDGETASVEGRAGETCTVTEAVPPLTGGYLYRPIIAPSSAAILLNGTTPVNVTNVVVGPNPQPSVPVTVKKVTSGDVEGYAANQRFDIAVNCPSLGSHTVQLGDGEVGTIPAVAGETCTVTETAVTPANYASTTIITASGQAAVNATSASFTVGASGSTVIVANSLKNTTSAVRLTFTEYLVGVSPANAYLFADVKFKVLVRCTSGYSESKWVTHQASATFDLGWTSLSQACEVSLVDASPANHSPGYAHVVMPGMFMVVSGAQFISGWTVPN